MSVIERVRDGSCSASPSRVGAHRCSARPPRRIGRRTDRLRRQRLLGCVTLLDRFKQFGLLSGERHRRRECNATHHSGDDRLDLVLARTGRPRVDQLNNRSSGLLGSRGAVVEETALVAMGELLMAVEVRLSRVVTTLARAVVIFGLQLTLTDVYGSSI